MVWLLASTPVWYCWLCKTNSSKVIWFPTFDLLLGKVHFCGAMQVCSFNTASVEVSEYVVVSSDLPLVFLCICTLFKEAEILLSSGLRFTNLALASNASSVRSSWREICQSSFDEQFWMIVDFSSWFTSGNSQFWANVWNRVAYWSIVSPVFCVEVRNQKVSKSTFSLENNTHPALS